MALIPTCGDWRSGIRRRVESGEPRSKSPRRRTIREWASLPQFRMRPLCGALATAGRRGDIGFAEETARCWLHPTQRQIISWALWAADAGVSALLGLRRFHR